MNYQEDYGFYFEKSGRAGYQGPNDPSSEYFTNVELEESLVREIIQNSMDAKGEGESTVTVEFDLRMLPTSQIPDIECIKVAIDQSLAASEDLQGRQYLEAARKAARAAELPILRIGDYGTRGLTGSESKNNPHSPLSVLTRGTGVSSDEGARGGSFGIGAAVGLVASKLRTVCYISKAEDKDDTVFAGLCRLASHMDSNGEWRMATGYYTRLDDEDDFQYLRNPSPLGSFPNREERGTDVYLFGYVEAANDPNLDKIRNACIRNFMVAIARGKLVVRGRSHDVSWTLDNESLLRFIQEDSELVDTVQPFYKALTVEPPIEKHLQHLGSVKLYLYVDDSMEKPLFTQVMRKPLMKVQTLRHRFPIPYAAIFICEEEPGNSKLRNIEPPTHDRWNNDGPRSDAALVQAIKRFIRAEISARMPQHYGSLAKIKGLERLLPSNIKRGDGNSTKNGSSSPANTAPHEDESAVRLGKPFRRNVHDRPDDQKVSVRMSRQGIATPDGTTEGRRGERHGEGSGKKENRREKDTKADLGSGKSKISAGSVIFRSFYDPISRATVLVLTGLEDVEGDLELVTKGAGEQDEFNAPIASATLDSSDGLVELSVDGSTIKHLRLLEGQKARLMITFTSDARYRLGVRNA